MAVAYIISKIHLKVSLFMYTFYVYTSDFCTWESRSLKTDARYSLSNKKFVPHQKPSYLSHDKINNKDSHKNLVGTVFCPVCILFPFELLFPQPWVPHAGKSCTMSP